MAPALSVKVKRAFVTSDLLKDTIPSTAKSRHSSGNCPNAHFLRSRNKRKPRSRAPGARGPIPPPGWTPEGWGSGRSEPRGSLPHLGPGSAMPRGGQLLLKRPPDRSPHEGGNKGGERPPPRTVLSGPGFGRDSRPCFVGSLRRGRQRWRRARALPGGRAASPGRARDRRGRGRLSPESRRRERPRTRTGA